MRLLARLLKKLRSTTKQNLSMYDYISNKHFDAIVASTEALCELQIDAEGHRAFKKPSVALQVGNALVKCKSLKMGMAVRDDDQCGIEEANLFEQLYNAEWSSTMSCTALVTLKINKFNTAQELPLTAV